MTTAQEFLDNLYGQIQEDQSYWLAKSHFAGRKITGADRRDRWVRITAIADALEVGHQDLIDTLCEAAEDGRCKVMQGEWLECPAE